MVKELKMALFSSYCVAIDGHRGASWTERPARLDMVPIQRGSKVFVLVPSVFPNVLMSVGNALKECVLEQRVFVWKGHDMLEFCRSKFG
jgi:hypothetical protein